MFKVLLLLVEFGDPSRLVDAWRLGLHLCREFSNLVIDHFIALDDTILLFERDGFILVLDQIAVTLSHLPSPLLD